MNCLDNRRGTCPRKMNQLINTAMETEERKREKVARAAGN